MLCVEETTHRQRPVLEKLIFMPTVDKNIMSYKRVSHCQGTKVDKIK